MKIIQVNLGNYGSTGSIALGINETARAEGMEAYIAYPWDSNNKPASMNDIYIGNEFGHRASRKIGKITGLNGCFSVFSTISLLKKIEKKQPDILHFHNLHNCYVNLPLLFWYIKRRKIPTVWTLHDCWAFTGQCPYFTLVRCEKWKTGCYDCPQTDRYPQANVDRTRAMWKLKKKWFSGVDRLIIVTPSKWLRDLVKESFLRDYEVKVINNGIDLSVFQPTSGTIRERLAIGNDFVILGVAFEWEKRKGLDVFVELAKILGNGYRIVLVGTDEKTDSILPKRIISIHRTQNQRELAEIYSMADLFFNPTREENYPTVNIEALACGTPVLTFDTGGSAEIVDSNCGQVILCEDVNSIAEKIKDIKEMHPYTVEACLHRAQQLSMHTKYQEYIALYRRLVEEKKNK